MRRWVKPVRTAIQVLITLIPFTPMLVKDFGIGDTTALGAALIAGSATLSHVMQDPQVEKLLEKLKINS